MKTKPRSYNYTVIYLRYQDSCEIARVSSGTQIFVPDIGDKVTFANGLFSGKVVSREVFLYEDQMILEVRVDV